MGNSISENATVKPVHPVNVSSFSMDKYEVTYDLYTKVRNWGLLHGYTDLGHGLNGCSGNGNTVILPTTSGANNPVTCVYWFDAVKWCNARSEMENLNPVYFTDNTLSTVYRTGQPLLNSDAVKWTANGYRLPTEAEWEFAAKGGTKTKEYLYSGSNAVDDVAWTKQNSTNTTHPIGKKAANELGIYDMSGNVLEMCWDWWGAYTSDMQSDPRGPIVRFLNLGDHRIARGGDCFNGSGIINGDNYPYTPTWHSKLVSETDWWGNVGFRCVGAPNSELTITNPALGETLLADAPYSIKWDATSIDSIKIEYSNDNGKTFHKINSSVAANKHGYLWHVPNTLSSKCKLVLTNLNDPSDTAVLSNFRIKGYVLTRFKDNGNYELFDPALHAWQFENISSNMWPYSWYSQFNYFGIDPYTNRSYPFNFIAPPVWAWTSNFIDWPLFVKTFSPGVCYENVSKAVYSPTAVNLWAKFKKFTYGGSCYGFSQSCLLAFDRPDQFRQVYPEVGNFQNIHDIPINESVRNVINQLFTNQLGSQHYLYGNKKLHTTDVRQTIADLKAYFLSDTDDHCALAFQTMSKAHNVVPYRLDKYTQENENTSGFYKLIVYDNNNPSGKWMHGNSTFILLDSLNNAWMYPPLNWVRVDSWGIYLNDPASQYLSSPLLWDPNPAQKNSIAKSAGGKTDAANYLSIYNTTFSDIAITNSVGQKIGFQDSVSYNTLGDGMPIIPENSIYQPPIGYFIPNDTYSIKMSAYTDSLAAFSVLSQTGMFNYWRSNALNNQTDRLNYDGGMGFSNSDPKTKTVNLEAINRSTDGENSFKILNFTVAQYDSVRLESSDFNRVAFINQGPAKIYDLNIVKACENSSGQIKHDRIPIPAHSTHFIVFDLQDLSNDSVKIYEDKGNTGIISDSILVANQVTGIEKSLNTDIDGKFSLIQIYPNPFNSSTTIKYKITEPGFVSLKVYNTMGTVVACLVKEQKPVGEYSIELNVAGLQSGIYFCRLQAGKFTDTKKLVLQK